MEVKITVRNKEYIIGKEYEFSDILQEEKWHKGVLMGYCPHPNSSNSFVCGNQYYVHCREKVEELDYDILKSCPIEGTIHSVKRLSDGEVFTIGDILKSGEKINSIKLIEGIIRVYPRHSFYYLSDVKKVKKTPLFTTEDGVDIFEGHDFFYPNTHAWVVLKTKANVKAIDYVIKVNKYKTFFNKEKAEEYVLLNKPCLSIMEVAPIFGQMHLDNSPDVLTRNLAKLKSLVQAKL